MQLIKNQINIEIPINIDTYDTCFFSSAIACGRVTVTMLKPKNQHRQSNVRIVSPWIRATTHEANIMVPHSIHLEARSITYSW